MCSLFPLSRLVSIVNENTFAQLISDKKVMSPGSALWALELPLNKQSLSSFQITNSSIMSEVSKFLTIPQIEKLRRAANYHI